MARADLLVSLVKAGARGDDKQFRRTVEALVAEERAKQHHVLADQLTESLRPSPSPAVRNGRGSDDQIQHMLFETTPHRTLDSLFLSDTVRQTCQEVIEEQHRVDLLRAYNLEPRHRILLAGPPGNGKTSIAEALAEALYLPLVTVRYEGLIGSFLGETATRLSRLFDYVRPQRCVLFFDEFDAIGKERGDIHETGEVKRVVSSLLLQIDALPSHVVVVCASNHPELLDRAVWRRFQVRLSLPPPSVTQLEEYFKKFIERFQQPLGHDPRTLATKLVGLSYAEAEEFTADIQRRYVLSQPNGDTRSIVTTRLKQWNSRFSPDPDNVV